MAELICGCQSEEFEVYKFCPCHQEMMTDELMDHLTSELDIRLVREKLLRGDISIKPISAIG